MRLVAGSERHSGFGALVCAAERVVAVQGHVSHAVGHEHGSSVHHLHDVAGVLQRTSGRLQDVAVRTEEAGPIVLLAIHDTCIGPLKRLLFVLQKNRSVDQRGHAEGLEQVIVLGFVEHGQYLSSSKNFVFCATSRKDAHEGHHGHAGNLDLVEDRLLDPRVAFCGASS